MSNSNHVNAQFLNDEIMAIRWYKPETQNEQRLLDMLKELIPLQEQVEELTEEKEELESKIDSLDDELIDYKNFYSDIVGALTDGGAWPDDSPRNEYMIGVICEYIQKGMEND